jgi:ribonucleoside-diphosphate reductase alpha chain
MAVIHTNGKSTTNGHALPETETGTLLEGIRQKVFADRYSLKDESGAALEHYPEQMWRRVARGIAAVETVGKDRADWEERFYRALQDFKFVPGGRILAGAGTGHEVTFYNCYVIPSPQDSRGGILENLSVMTEIMARGGGVGINLSSLRPRGSYIRSVNGTASGPCSWGELYSVATGDVIQQGGSRRGALMLMLDDWHPDIEEFITVKTDLSRINHANLSICASDSFMEAVKRDGDWDLVFPDTTDPEYDDVWNGDLTAWKARGKGVNVYRTVKAREIWSKICEAAWRSAEPGLVFMERYQKRSNTWYFEQIRCVNPCGEQGLPEWGVCNLGALNLAAFVEDGEMDYTLLAKTAKVAIRFLDNVIDATPYFIEDNEHQQRNGTRRTGLGTMGLADALIRMKVRYGSRESIPVIGRIYRTIRDASYSASVDIAREKGAFPQFEREKYMEGSFIKQLPAALQEQIAEHGIRNGVLLTQAPTGTTSLLSGVSSGIEPVFDFAMKRVDRTGEHILYHPLFKEWKDVHNGEPVPEYFAASNDLGPEDHVRVQATIQEFTDSSISKTVNAPNSYEVADVEELYTLAYDLGCKGITFFRDGSRTPVLSRVEEKKEEETKKSAESDQANSAAVPIEMHPRKRPAVVAGVTVKKLTARGELYVTINAVGEGEDKRPIEIFLTLGKAGTADQAYLEALARSITLGLRSGVPIKEHYKHLRGIGSLDVMGIGPNRVLSVPDAIAQVIAEIYEIPTGINGDGKNGPPGGEAASVVQLGLAGAQAESHVQESRHGEICPDCGAAGVVFEEGCEKCLVCGYSRC